MSTANIVAARLAAAAGVPAEAVAARPKVAAAPAPQPLAAAPAAVASPRAASQYNEEDGVRNTWRRARK
jgi:hypothetical protein